MSLMDEILNLETMLLTPKVRKSKEEIEKLLSDEFVEFCSTGRIYKYSKGDTFYEEGVSYEILDFSISLIEENSLLATYRLKKRSKGGENYSLRSSIWKIYNGEYKMVFHQGTIG